MENRPLCGVTGFRCIGKLHNSRSIGHCQTRGRRKTNSAEAQIENLDVLRTDRALNIGSIKGRADESGERPHFCSLYAQRERIGRAGGHYLSGGTRYITLPQATNIMEAVDFAKTIDLPLVAHLTIHWAFTDAGDDPEGTLFAKVREGLDKWLGRHGIVFAGIWSRERMSRGQSEVVHCHLLFHLPNEFRAERRIEVERALYRLIKRHGGDYWADEAIKLVIWPNPDGKYLIKGGGPNVWKRFGVRKEHRQPQGLIIGKRCGTTQNLGPAARRRAASIAITIKEQAETA